MLEHGADERRPSNDRKRALAVSDGHDTEAKRQTVTGVRRKNVSSNAGYVGGQIPSYPVSSLYHSPPQRSDAEATTNGSYFRHSRHPASSSGNCIMGPAVQLTKRDLNQQRSGFPYELAGDGYPGQYETQQVGGVVTRRSYDMEMPPVASYSPPQTKRNRFNLARYQLDEDDESFTSLPSGDPMEKPNRFKTQRERLILAAREQRSDEGSGSAPPSFDDQTDSRSCEDSDSSSESRSQSQDSYMSQRERLRRFSSEHARHVAIPNEWEGETNLQDFVAFGNIEAALRPLGLMMARAALVSDSVATRSHLRPESSGPSTCHSRLNNSLAL